jgi:hypothetical protein
MDRRAAWLHPTRDHVLPRSRGGTRTIICCATCNGIKGDMLPLAWEAFMEANPRWWKLSRRELRLLRRDLVQADAFRRIGQRQGAPPLPPVIVPKELIYGHGEEGNTDRVTAVVGSPAEMEARVLEEGT